MNNYSGDNLMLQTIGVIVLYQKSCGNALKEEHSTLVSNLPRTEYKSCLRMLPQSLGRSGVKSASWYSIDTYGFTNTNWVELEDH